MQELTPQSIERAKRGDRFVVESIEEKDFQERARAFKEAAEARGIAVGTVYHRPIKTGVIFVK